MKRQKIMLFIGTLTFVLLLALAAVLYHYLSRQIEPEPPMQLATQSGDIATPTENQQAPDFTVLDADGNSIKLSDLMGKPIVLNFWASWCPPCKREMPDFEAVYAELGDHVHFMMVNLTNGIRETLSSAQSYIAEQGYTFPVYFDTTQEAATAYSVYSIPTTFFIDANSSVVTYAQGALTEANLRKGIALIRPAED